MRTEIRTTRKAPEPGIDYVPLDASANEIRLIRLHCKSQQSHSGCMDPDTISCNLERYVRGKCPEYVAISYSWEPLHLAEDTNINGTLHRVSTTVADALRYLRHEDKDRYVWLDQICINQRDDMEKSDQVQHMHAIYSDAERVIAWLGPASEDSNLLFDHMQKTGDALIARDYDSVAQLHEGDDKLKTLAHAFDSICKRKYWQRLWVIQEFAVAKEVLLACGGSSMNMKTVEIVMLASNASRYPNDEGEPPIDADLLRKLASVYLSPAKSFAENLVSRRQRYHYVEYGETFNYFFRVLTTSLVLEVDYNWPMTTDPRDRIFALLNLAHDAAEFPAFPDYSMTCQKVYTEAAFRLLEQGHIDLLCYSQFPKTFKYLPSWVPDWNMEVRGPNVHSSWECKFSASGSRNDQPVTRVGLEQVSLQGVLVDTIKEFGEVFDPNWLEQVDIPRARAHFTNIRRYCQMSPRIRTHEEVLDAARIATADCARYGDTTANENYLQGWVWSMEHYLGKQALDDQETEESSDDSTSHRGGIPRSQQSDEEEGCDWFMHGLRHLHSRRPFLTSSGFVGLCPWNVAIGDVLCIFLGGKTPYAVRPAAHGTYRLVGEAYVHGIMFGEFMKGEPEVREMILR